MAQELSQTTKRPTIADIRTKGQVWTPRWVADAMAAYVSRSLPGKVLDPAVGPGSLLASVRDLGLEDTSYFGFEIDESVLTDFNSDETFRRANFSRLELENFLLSERTLVVDAVIANPPYLRHHLIPKQTKDVMARMVGQVLETRIDARAGLHVYFLVKALKHLAAGGRLAFLIPSDVFEGVFANSLWKSITAKFRVEAILTFAPNSAAFPGVDTNASVVFLSNTRPDSEYLWMQWNGKPDKSLAHELGKVFGGDVSNVGPDLRIVPSGFERGLQSGLNRDQSAEFVQGVSFQSLATVVRGIATGDNSFFLMTRAQIHENGLDEKLFVRTVVRVRDVQSDRLSLADLDHLDELGRPTFLLYLNNEPNLSEEVRTYLARGEENGLPQRSLIKSRSKWYFTETRNPVPILFCYLGRRNQRFIRCECEVRPTTGFLCVYPHTNLDPDRLITALNHPLTLEQLAQVGKSYGDGAIKVEPGGLRKLIVPSEALIEAGITPDGLQPTTSGIGFWDS